MRNQFYIKKVKHFKKRDVIFGLCVPKECEQEEGSLNFLNHLYKLMLKTSNIMDNPEEPTYSFPDKE